MGAEVLWSCLDQATLHAAPEGPGHVFDRVAAPDIAGD